MGHQWLSSGTRSYAPTQRLAGGAHWSQISLPLVFFGLHALLCLMRSGLVGKLVDRISRPPGHERWPDGSVDADDDGACCRKACGARHGLRGCADPDGADPWPGHRRCHSATRLLALALPGQPAGRCIGNRPGGSLFPQRSRGDPVERTRSSWFRPALSRTRALPVRIGSSGRAYRSYGSSGFHRSACGLLQDGHSKRGQGAHRSSALQEKNLLCVRHHAVHVERNLVRGPDADSDLSHPRLWSIAERDGLAAGSAWSGDDLFLSMDGSPDKAVWYTKGIGRRRASGLFRHAAISLPGQSRTRLRGAGRCSIPARSGPERSWHSLDLGCIRFRQKAGPADGDNLTQHRAASGRPDSYHALCDLPRMEVGDGTVQRQPLERIYRCVSSTLRITRFPVCCRPEITSFPGQGDRTTSCRRIACFIGGDVRVIERVEAIHSPNASGAPNNLNFRIPGGLRATRKERPL